MADYIRYNYPKMAMTRDQLTNHGKAMISAANDLKTAMDAAIAEWTGPTKDAFQEYMTNHVYKYMQEDVPNVAVQLADLLENNMKNMGDTDDTVANNITK